ncbi:hypothetical protein HETIRDRAFT_447381 [Heterobasidion irregulare TC 32-1]|uniref:Uncharacterized protein n=1 Tax=Heterobasidion irregulare (strain TC 32-1) TaxID=747525 RepID=W4KLU9_HETIT|nr:uncharacterized protein HETIRDRAFT_447381 [Heterobasidion irregulare TC 32-1]ETW86694.1 hypothetical protein HETIRDRAFT_447381 [Heterobasidion irregulare TC 32-1]
MSLPPRSFPNVSSPHPAPAFGCIYTPRSLSSTSSNSLPAALIPAFMMRRPPAGVDHAWASPSRGPILCCPSPAVLSIFTFAFSLWLHIILDARKESKRHSLATILRIASGMPTAYGLRSDLPPLPKFFASPSRQSLTGSAHAPMLSTQWAYLCPYPSERPSVRTRPSVHADLRRFRIWNLFLLLVASRSSEPFISALHFNTDF